MGRGLLTPSARDRLRDRFKVVSVRESVTGGAVPGQLTPHQSHPPLLVGAREDAYRARHRKAGIGDGETRWKMRRAMQLALLALAACGGDDPRVLSESEALALFRAMGPVVLDGERASHPADSIQVMVCPDGGNIESVVRNETSWEGETLVVSTSMIAAPRGCVLEGLVVEGNPSVVYAQTFKYSSPWFVYGTAMGEVKWSLHEPDGTVHDGTCSIEMTIDALVAWDYRESTGTFLGKLCGHHFELDVKEYENIWMISPGR